MLPSGSLYDSIITIEVGPKPPKAYWLHEGILCHHSLYFREALRGDSSESQQKVIKLEETEVKVFDAFKNWLYTGKLFDTSTLDDPKVFDVLCKIWIFGNRRGVPGLKNAAADAFIDQSLRLWILPDELFLFIYDNTSNGAQLRTLIADLLVLSRDLLEMFTRLDGSLVERYPKQLLLDVLRSPMHKDLRFQSIASKIFIGKMDRCKYHDHRGPDEI
ncbi:hypothetical protein NA57DRAFT_74123 [Rhizodiscina lignyota]|uniref:BTB domain-containing protein n=1 Tax=Rhizodiscina lignyota TaxID=1504668 RepID=A0A9P4ILA8_9PEZI|nr:hypothetical protein NA57DRAFT_74123 [Rhizodiscina lignyota]